MVIQSPSMFLRIQYMYVHDVHYTDLVVGDVGFTYVQTEFSVT